MKNTLDGIKSRLDITKEKITELEYIAMENIQNESKEINKMNKELVNHGTKSRSQLHM